MEQEQGRIKTSVNLDRDLYRDLRVFAARRDRRIVDVMEDAIREYLERHWEQKGER